MSESDRYARVHKAAKLITFMLVVLCLVVNRQLDLVIIDIVAVFIWFFGVNSIAYVIESIVHWEHKHDRF